MATKFEEKIKQQIAEQVDLSGFTIPQRNKIVSQLLENISLKINVVVLDKLGDEDRRKIIKFLKTNSKDTILDYLNIKIKDLPEVVEGAVEETIEEFKKNSGN